jgi:hypothetical protein
MRPRASDQRPREETRLEDALQRHEDALAAQRKLRDQPRETPSHMRIMTNIQALVDFFFACRKVPTETTQLS